MLANASPDPVCALWGVYVLNVSQDSKSGKKTQWTKAFAFIEGAIFFLSPSLS